MKILGLERPGFISHGGCHLKPKQMGNPQEILISKSEGNRYLEIEWGRGLYHVTC